MKFPHKVPINGVWHNIVYCDREIDVSPDSPQAIYIESRAEIRVFYDPNRPKTKIMELLWHEVCHGIIDQLCIKGCSSDDDIEIFVRRFSVGSLEALAFLGEYFTEAKNCDEVMAHAGP